MRLKSFTAKTMREAMQMVRDSLGEDAVIVSTREDKGIGTVSVTAAVEKRVYDFEVHDEEDHYNEVPSNEWLYDEEEDEFDVVDEITDALLHHSVPEEIMDQIISYSSLVDLEDARISLMAAIENIFDFQPISRKKYENPLMLVGAPGTGKTLSVAKLAARGVMDGYKVSVITTDTMRAGGVEQLEAFTRLMNIDLKKAKDHLELRDRIEEVRWADQILIDTSGINPFDVQGVKGIARLAACSDIEPVLTLPAGCDAEESGDIARVFSMIGVERMMPTRLDAARRIGGLLCAAEMGELSFTDASNTAKVAGGLVQMSPKRLSMLLIPKGSDNAVENAERNGQANTRKTG
jgi:flagellar biosynthesis protein FlhF